MEKKMENEMETAFPLQLMGLELEKCSTSGARVRCYR